MKQDNQPKIFGQVINGFVGRELVVAHVYFGMDAGLSNYLYRGKRYSGTVQFSCINHTKDIL